MGGILKHTVVGLIVYGLIIAAVALLFLRLPSSFLPEEDQGYFITVIQLPVGATQARTIEVLKQMEDYFIKQPEVDGIITVAGFSFNGRGQNAAISFCRLKDWDERRGAQHKVQAIIGRAFAVLSQIKDATIYPINPPPIPELGNAAGIDFQLEDQAGLGHTRLVEAQNQLIALAGKSPDVVGMRVQGTRRRRATHGEHRSGQGERARGGPG